MLNTRAEDYEMIRVQVAERLGWHSIEYSKDGYLIGYPAGRRLFAVIPSFVRDIKAAWTLVDYLGLFGIRMHLDVIGSGAKRAITAEFEYQGKTLVREEGLTAPLCICEAFLHIRAEHLSCPLRVAS